MNHAEVYVARLQSDIKQLERDKEKLAIKYAKMKAERNGWIHIAKDLARKRVWMRNFTVGMGEALVRAHRERAEMIEIVTTLIPDTPSELG